MWIVAIHILLRHGVYLVGLCRDKGRKTLGSREFTSYGTMYDEFQLARQCISHITITMYGLRFKRESEAEMITEKLFVYFSIIGDKLLLL